MGHKLNIYSLQADGTSVRFPNSETPLVLSDFSASYNRMGAVPEITASVFYPTDIDHLWSYDVYVEFRGEKFFLKNLPKYTKENTNHQYEYPLTFVSERSVLDGKYMIDAVQSDSTIDGYQSNSTKVVFMGDIHELAKRLTAAMAYSGLDYSVVVDDGISTEPILVSFDNKMLSEAISEGFNLFKIPYYFVGKVCHYGYYEYSFQRAVSYGIGNGLLSLGETNTGARIINRISGRGSSDNIPFFYPNNSPKGNVKLTIGSGNKGVHGGYVKNYRKFANHFEDGQTAEYREPNATVLLDRLQYCLYYKTKNPTDYDYRDLSLDDSIESESGAYNTIDAEIKVGYKLSVRAFFTISGNANVDVMVRLPISTDIGMFSNMSGSVSVVKSAGTNSIIELFKGRVEYDTTNQAVDNYYIVRDVPPGHYRFSGTYSSGFNYVNDLYHKVAVDESFALVSAGWYLGDKKYTLDELGVYSYDEPVHEDIIGMSVIDKIPFASQLMPPIYRDTLGVERFYNAKNNTYLKPDGSGEYYEFKNEYSPKRPSEYIEEKEEKKPTIKGMTNASGRRIDMFVEFAYDLNDNDYTKTDSEGSEEYQHPYFYAKLPKFDGNYGFNLFDHSIENEEMVISMTSGVCGACKFTIMVDENTQRNLVLVDDNGELRRDAEGRVLMSDDTQGLDSQNDTRNNEVWIALKKDTSAYGQIMPNVEYSHYPSTNDTFVILHIDLPESYIRSAEKELEEYIIDSMANLNEDRYTPSLLFSRIFLKKDEEYRELLNENSRITVFRSGKYERFFISALTYNFADKEILPEITVQLLREFVSVSSNVSSIVSAAKDGIIAEVYGSALLNDRFLRKDIPDTSDNRPTFRNGVAFSGMIGTSNFRKGTVGGVGGAMYEDGDGNVVVEADRLIVRKDADFNSLVINQTTFQLGATVFSSAGCEIIRVEELNGAYRCYYDNEKGNSRSGFVVGDQARCQQYSPNYNGVVKYYWRVVVGFGDDYVDLAIDGNDDNGVPLVDGTDTPAEGDNIVHFGNRTDSTRQSAIIIDPTNSGSVEVYSDIDNFTLDGKNFVGLGVNPQTNRAYLYGYGDMFFGDRNLEKQYITYQIPEGKEEPELRIKANVELGADSSGLSNLSEFNSLTAKVEEQSTTIDKFGTDLEAVKAQSDKEYTIWFENEAQEGQEPTLDNYPASEWTTEELLKSHLQDLYYADSIGKAWRFELVGGVYVWNEITDANTIAALDKAQEALNKANDTQEQIDNIAYLKSVFPNSVGINYGASVALLLAVMNEKNVIKAGMYGGGSSILNASVYGFKDVTHGILSFFAGSNGILAKDSKFKVYEDGTVFAQQGVFGGILKKSPTTITSSTLSKYALETNGNETVLNLAETGSLIIFSGDFSEIPYLRLPSVTDYGTLDEQTGEWTPNINAYPSSGLNYEEFLSYLGAQVVLVNNTSDRLFGCDHKQCYVVEPNCSIVFDCVPVQCSPINVGTTTSFDRLGVGWNKTNGINIDI